MLQKIELNDSDEIVHMSVIYGNEGEQIIDPTPDVGLIVDDKHVSLFKDMMDNADETVKVYQFKDGKIKKKEKSKVNKDLSDWAAIKPIKLPSGYNKNSKGKIKSNPKEIQDLSPEELAEITPPIPTYDDFDELPDDFIKEDKYPVE